MRLLCQRGASTSARSALSLPDWVPNFPVRAVEGTHANPTTNRLTEDLTPLELATWRADRVAMEKEHLQDEQLSDRLRRTVAVLESVGCIASDELA